MAVKSARDWSRRGAHGGPDLGIGAKLAFLARAEAYPEASERVEVLETHMSWVFLTERFAYKLKKPVRYEFLDFRTIPARRHYCEEEIRLNRRLAPETYLRLVPLTMGRDGKLCLGGFGEPVDWLVKMYRLPRKRMLDQAIANRSVREPQIRGVALFLAEFYRDAAPVAMTPRAYRERLNSEVTANLRHLRNPSIYAWGPAPRSSIAWSSSVSSAFSTRPTNSRSCRWSASAWARVSSGSWFSRSIAT
jgi:hypothetical protein